MGIMKHMLRRLANPRNAASTRTRASGLSLSVAVLLVSALPLAAHAIPALQLGPGASTTDWTYDTVTETWVYQGTQPVPLYAYANATTGNGFYAWDSAGATDQYAYLVIAAVPDLGNTDVLDLAVTGASFVASGYGTPPVEDPNSLAPHGIFDTWFEIYEFRFEGPVGTIADVQPGQSGTGDGYTENISVQWAGLNTTDVTGVHFDLFTVAGDGKYVPGSASNKQLVKAFAPYSHDAGSGDGGGGVPPQQIPEPATTALLGLGLAGFGFVRRRRRS